MKITVPETNLPGQTPRIDVNAPVGGAQSIANVVKQTGQQLEALGKQYMNTAYNSIQDTYANQSSSKATLEFTQRYNERINQKVDKNGNPTYATLEKDIDEIANDVRMKYGAFLTDPNTKGRFNNHFDSLYVNKKIQASNEARAQHLDYSRAAISSSISDYIDAAEKDNGNNSELYRANIESTITDGLKSGVLDFSEAEKLRSSARNSIKSVRDKATIDSIRSQVEADPEGFGSTVLGKSAEELGIDGSKKKALDAEVRKAQVVKKKEIETARVESLLSNISNSGRKALEDFQATPAEQLGMTEIEKRKLTNLGQAAVKDAEEKVQREEAEIKRQQKDYFNQNELLLKIGIKKEQLGSADIEEAKLTGKIDDAAYLSLLEYNDKGSKAKSAEIAKNEQIDQAITEGVPLLDRFEPKDIEKRVSSAANDIAGKDEQGNQINPTASNMLQAAASYQVAYKPLADKMSNLIRLGSPESAKEVADNYDEIAEFNPQTLELMKEEDIAAIEYFKDSYNKGGMTVEDALKTARELIFNPKDPEKKAVKAKLKDEVALKPDNIGATVADMYGLSGRTRFGTYSVEPMSKQYLEDSLRSAYLATNGDLDKAKEVVKKKNGKLFGISEINETKGIINDTEQFMYLPPENVYGEYVRRHGTKLLRQDIENTFKDDLPAEIDPSNIRVRGDYLSRPSDITKAKTSDYSWAVYYVEPTTGIERRLLDPKDPKKFLRWRFDFTENKQAEDKVNETKVKSNTLLQDPMFGMNIQ